MGKMKEFLMDAITEFAALHGKPEEEIYKDDRWYDVAVKYADAKLKGQDFNNRLREGLLKILSEVSGVSVEDWKELMADESPTGIPLNRAVEKLLSDLRTAGEIELPCGRKVWMGECL